MNFLQKFWRTSSWNFKKFLQLFSKTSRRIFLRRFAPGSFRQIPMRVSESSHRKFWEYSQEILVSFAGNSRSFSLKFSQENLRFFLKIFSRIFPVFFFRNFARKFSKISSGNIPDFLRKKSLGNSYKFPRKIQIK